MNNNYKYTLKQVLATSSVGARAHTHTDDTIVVSDFGQSEGLFICGILVFDY